MTRPVACALFLGVFLLTPAPVRANALQAFFQRAKDKGKEINTLECDFVQKKQMALFRTEITTHGRVRYSRPDSLRWETFAPDESLLVVTKGWITFHLPGEPPRRIPRGGEGITETLVTQMLAWLALTFDESLEQHYHARLIRSGQETGLTLKPRDEALAERIDLISLRIDDELRLRSILVHQPNGDTTQILFSNIKKNMPLSKEIPKQPQRRHSAVPAPSIPTSKNN